MSGATICRGFANESCIAVRVLWRALEREREREQRRELEQELERERELELELERELEREQERALEREREREQERALEREREREQRRELEQELEREQERELELELERELMKCTEREHQVAMFAWAKAKEVEHPKLDLLYHCPNGGHRNIIVARRLKSEGVKPGVPDLFLPVARKGFHGWFAELKAEKGKLSHNQEYWRYRLLQEGYKWGVFYDWRDAADDLEEYLK